ncbi:MAG: hypothetical protein HYY86_03275 [Candidatus Harrisonbacteria bacterium]|nr:hypothetical protein [Candidatus Harrisonbacteria bacterium]
MDKKGINFVRTSSKGRVFDFSYQIRLFSFASAVILATFYIVYLVSGANTTIGNNITSSGTLNITGASNLAALTLSGTFNASSTLQVTATSTFYSAVGIGTTSPGALLAVQGNAIISGNFNAANITATGTLTATNASTTGMLTVGNGAIIVGSSTVSNSLQVAGNIQASSSVSVGGVLALTGTTGTSTIASGQGFTIGSTQFVLQQGSGNVGIGTANPARPLTVIGTIRSGEGDGTDTDGRLTLAWDASLDLGDINAYQSGYKQLNINASPLVLNNDISGGAGNVGIGTTSPAQRLAVQGNVYLSGNLTNVANIIATGTLNVTGVTTLTNASTTGQLTIGNGFISSASSTVASSLQVAGAVYASSTISASRLAIGTGTSTYAGNIESAALGITGTSTLLRAFHRQYTRTGKIRYLRHFHLSRTLCRLRDFFLQSGYLRQFISH